MVPPDDQHGADADREHSLARARQARAVRRSRQPIITSITLSIVIITMIMILIITTTTTTIITIVMAVCLFRDVFVRCTSVSPGFYAFTMTHTAIA